MVPGQYRTLIYKYCPYTLKWPVYCRYRVSDKLGTRKILLVSVWIITLNTFFVSVSNKIYLVWWLLHLLSRWSQMTVHLKKSRGGLWVHSSYFRSLYNICASLPHQRKVRGNYNKKSFEDFFPKSLALCKKSINTTRTYVLVMTLVKHLGQYLFIVGRVWGA